MISPTPNESGTAPSKPGASVSPSPVLRAPAVVLRPYQPADLPVFMGWMRDPALWAEQATPMPPPEELSDEALSRLFAMLTAGGTGRLFWIMADADTDQPLGQASLEREPAEADTAEIGLEIPEASRRRRGLGRQVLDTLIPYAFSELKLSRLTAHTHAGNLASQKLFESAGFRLVQRRDEGLQVWGHAVQSLVYEKVRPGLTPSP